MVWITRLSPSLRYPAVCPFGSVTETAFDDDPLLRTAQVIPPGHTSNNAVDTRYGNWGVESGLGRSYMTVEDEKGVLSTSVYDAYGRMRYAIADSAGTSAGTMNNRTSNSNDALDRLTSTTMPGGGTSTYAYVTLGRLSIRHHPDADGATRYKYDDLGRVTRVGEATATFSSLDPESTYAFESNSSSWRSRMTYDDDLLATGPNYGQGRLSKIEENTDADAEIRHEYAFDHLGNVCLKRVTIEGLTASRTIEYVHDLAGRVTRLIYPDGAQARYAYDGAGRLARVWDERGGVLAAYTHSAAGNIATHVVGHGAGHIAGGAAGDGIVTGAYTYNAREWATRIDYPGIFTVSQQYDAVGNVSSQNYHRAASESEKAAAYTYDNLHRLTGFDLDGGAHTRSYAYDRNGNITRVTTNGADTHYSYNSRTTPNRLDFVLGAGNSFQSYTYNENGWTTAMGDASLTYDYRGLTTGVGTAAYLMDPDRRRVKKTVGTVTTYYLRGADGTVLAEYTGQTLSARYVYAGSRRIARVASSSKRYYLADHLGSTRSLVDETGTVTAAYDYWPYGKILALSGTGTTHFRFTGHERDAESGLDYMLERSYGSEIGRFLRPDPMQDEYPGLSPYAYAANNPLKYVDPDGRALVIGALVGAAIDVGVQIAIEGRSVNEIDLVSVGISAAAGATGVGLFTKLPALGRAAKFGIESGVDATFSAINQLNESGEVNLNDTVTDVFAGVIGGRVSQFSKNKAGASSKVQELRNQADRKRRIANNATNPASARRRTSKAYELNEKADNIVTRIATSAGIAASNAASNFSKWLFDDEEEKDN